MCSQEITLRLSKTYISQDALGPCGTILDLMTFPYSRSLVFPSAYPLRVRTRPRFKGLHTESGYIVIFLASLMLLGSLNST